jgi:4-coumarate--CoA ligase
MIFKSTQPDIDRTFLSPSQQSLTNSPSVPTNQTTYTWLFSSPSSPLKNHPHSTISGFTNALTKERLSYASIKSHTTHLSTALVKNFNLKKGDTVALFSQNTIWYPVALLAVSRVAGIVSGASPAYNIEEMTYALKVSKAKFLFTVEGSMGIAAAAADNAGIGKERVFLLEGKMEGFRSMAELLEMGRGYGEGGQVEEYMLKEGEKNGDLCGFLSFSSGTTGLPKAVCSPFPLRLHNLIHSILNPINQRKS